MLGQKMKTAILWLLPVAFLSAQEFHREEWPFVVDDQSLSNPLGGGLNSPQFSSARINEDSLPDLFIFERSGNKVLIFLATEEEERPYVYAPTLEVSFPDLSDWAILKDFNEDSIPDIFTYSNTGAPGIDVYRGRRDEGLLSFEKMFFDNPVKVLGYPTSTGAVANIFVSALDLPAISDLDADGDLDILSFQSDGTKVFYYKNLVRERALKADTFDFILEDRCWGKFVESFNSNAVLLSDDPEICPSDFNQNARLHGGSTLAVFDQDFDGDQELLLGDLTFETLLLLENGGTPDRAYITAQRQNFPSYDVPVFIPFFPAAFVQDFDGDGIPDFISSPNQEDARENVEVAWHYRGFVDNGILRFQFEQSDFLIRQMLDFGTDASPHFFDYNQDGLIDLIVGSRFHSNYDNQYPSQLFLFQNKGNPSSPAYELVESNWLNMKSLISEVDALYPTSVDLDNDGDLDLIVGNKRGKLAYIENASVPGSAFTVGEVHYPWMDIDVGFASVPTFFDREQDGDMDLLVGEERGNINFFLNQGTPSEPFFDPAPSALGNNENFGGIDARQNRAVFGSAAPQVFQKKDSSFLLVGSTYGNFLLYPLDGDLDTLNTLNGPHTDIKDGARSRATLADIDRDGYLELCSGSSRGGLAIYHTPWLIDPTVSTNEEPLPGEMMSVYPMPAHDWLHIELVNGIHLTNLQVINSLGQRMTAVPHEASMKRIPIHHLPPGVYFLKAYTTHGTITKQWIKF